MISYTKLLKTTSSARKNVWYICGTDSALVHDAIDIAKQHIYNEVTEVCLGVFFGKGDKEALKEFILRPYYEERKLIIIYDAHSILDLPEIIDVSDTSTFYLIIDYDRSTPNDHLNEFLVKNSKVRSINCSSKGGQELEGLIRSRLSIVDDAVNLLISRSHGDAEWVLNKVSILERFDVDSISRKLVELVCTDEGVPNFEDSLIQFDKQMCFLYINSVGVDNIDLYKIATEAHNLSLLNTVAVDYKKEIRPVSDRTGLSQNKVREDIKYAPYYDAQTSKRCFATYMKLYGELVKKNKLAYVTLVSGW